MTDHVAAITTYLASILATVPGIGLVHTFEPVVTEPGQVPATMGKSGAIHFWTVKRTATPQDWIANVETERHPTWTIRGQYEVGDPSVSEPILQALIETVMETFRALYQAPQSSGADAEVLGALQLLTVDYRRLADTWTIHYVELRITALIRTSP